MIQEKDLTLETFLSLIEPVLGDRERLAEMEENTRGRGRPNAASDIVKDLISITRNPKMEMSL